MVYSRECTVLALVGMVLLAASVTHGRTWYVEKNGMGDFTVIQDAVDAARSGDVIQIGPGRYTEYMVVEGWGPLGYGNMYVWLDGTKSLTLIGAGDEETIIGPDVYASGYTDMGVVCDSGDVRIELDSLRIENQNLWGAAFYGSPGIVVGVSTPAFDT